MASRTGRASRGRPTSTRAAARRADFRARILAKKSARKSVLVSVSGPVEFKLNPEVYDVRTCTAGVDYC